MGTDVTPLDVCGVTLRENGDGLAVDVEFAVLGGNIAFKAAVDRVIFEHVDLTKFRYVHSGDRSNAPCIQDQ